MLSTIVMIVQLLVSVALVCYIVYAFKSRKEAAPEAPRVSAAESVREMDKLRKLRQLSLTTPLSERIRPAELKEIIGQEEGLMALRAILCGPNPQHVIIYGPPGIGKTCAARLMLEEAKKTPGSPFKPEAAFIEMDATCLRFDERAIADPLIGSVHDPIYQGAGPLGVHGVPQPKPGAVTRAHGGVLFLDEIGELHPIQMNKLLKVLEDRRVMLDSAYYNPDDTSVPRHIHDIFKNGLPADFRLVGATTRSPSELPSALRSRCMEVFFRPLTPEENTLIADRASIRAGFVMEAGGSKRVAQYSRSGRDAVNIVQVAAGLAQSQERRRIMIADIDWVLKSGHYAPCASKLLTSEARVGAVAGLAVAGAGMGLVMDIEAVATPVVSGSGKLKVTGIIDEEESGDMGHRVRRRSMASGSVEAVSTVLRRLGLSLADYDVHVNYPGGVPVDGPSAGVAMAVAVWSAITSRPVDGRLAMTGEVSVQGNVMPVGGVAEKVEAAVRAGAKRVLIPRENWQAGFSSCGAQVIVIDTISEALDHALFPAILEPASGGYAEKLAIG